MPLYQTFRWLLIQGAQMLASVGQFSAFTLQTLADCVRPPWRTRLILNQAYLLGIRGMPVAILTALFVGMVIVLQAGTELAIFNVKQFAAAGRPRP